VNVREDYEGWGVYFPKTLKTSGWDPMYDTLKLLGFRGSWKLIVDLYLPVSGLGCPRRSCQVAIEIWALPFLALHLPTKHLPFKAESYQDLCKQVPVWQEWQSSWAGTSIARPTHLSCVGLIPPLGRSHFLQRQLGKWETLKFGFKLTLGSSFPIPSTRPHQCWGWNLGLQTYEVSALPGVYVPTPQVHFLTCLTSNLLGYVSHL
jgi:hypothetical protein